MGKGIKRKNAGVGVDFRKVKHKVGRKLPKAANETRTDFTSRSIALPTQSLAAERGGAAVSERNLTLKELLAQLTHHNAGTRRDALTGIGQLIAAHPGEARRHAASLLDSLAPRVSDGDEGVRAALLAVMRGPVSAALGPEGLAPFAPLLLAHASAALSHLSADVRLDALGVLEALAVSAPRAIVREPVALSGLLRHYCGLLGRAHRGKSVRSQALAGLLRVLSSLERLLAAAQPPASTLGSGGNSGGSGGTTDGPVPAPAGAPPEGLLLPLAAARAARAPLTATRLPQAEELLRRYADTASAAPISASLGRSTAPNTAAAAGDAPGSSPEERLHSAALSLLVVLFECWAEAAPGSLSVAPELESTQALVMVLSCCWMLLAQLQPLGASSNSSGDLGASMTLGTPLCPCLRTGSGDGAQLWRDAAAIVLPRLLPVFPACAPSVRLPAALQATLAKFNLLSVQLLSGFARAGAEWPPALGRGKSSARSAALAAQQGWQSRLLAFASDVLTTGSCLPTSALTTLELQVDASDVSGLLTVLQSVQQLLPMLPSEPREQLLLSVDALLHAPGAKAQQQACGVEVEQQQPQQQKKKKNQQQQQQQRQATLTGPLGLACLQLQLQLLSQCLLDALPCPSQESAVARWVAAAPRLLWDAGSRRPACSLLLLRLLFQAARLSRPGSQVHAALCEPTQPQLAALFATPVPARRNARTGGDAAAAAGAVRQPHQDAGSKESTGTSDTTSTAAQTTLVVLGPLCALPEDAQALACDTLALLPVLQPSLLRAAALACRLSCYSDGMVHRLSHALMAAAPRTLPPSDLLSLAATLLAPPPPGGYADVQHPVGSAVLSCGWVRHAALIDAVCGSLHTYAPLCELLPLLAPTALSEWQSAQQSWQQQQQQKQQQSMPVTLPTAGQTSAALRLRCSSYAVASLAALARDCWGPTAAPVMQPSIADEAQQQRGSMPDELADALQDACRDWLASSVADEVLVDIMSVSGTEGVAARGEDSSRGGAAVRAAAVRGVDACMPALLRLARASPALSLPKLAVACCGKEGACEVAHGAGLAAAMQILDAALAQPMLRVPLLAQAGTLRGALSDLVAAAQLAQPVAWRGEVAQHVARLQAASELLLGASAG